MAVAPKFDDGLYNEQQPQPPQSSSWKSCLIGCLVVAGVVALLILVIAIWISYNWRSMAANLATEVTNQMIDESELPAQEKAEIKEQLNRVVVAFRDNKLTAEQWETLFKKLQQSPLLTSLAVWVVDTKYFDKSGLSAEEKTEGRQTLRRLARGAIDEKISQQTLDSVLAPIGTRGPNGDWNLKETVTDEELRTFLANAKAAADAAEIPDQPADIDLSAEIKKIIDDAMGPPADAVEPAAAPPLQQ